MQNNPARNIERLQKIETFLRKLVSRNRILSIIVLLGVPVFVLTVGFQTLKSRQAAAAVAEKNAALQQQIEQLEAQNAQHLAVLNNDDPDVFRDYVIRTAREQLGLSLPGDQVFIDRSLFQPNQQ